MSDEMPVWVRRLLDQTKIVVFCLVLLGLVSFGVITYQNSQDDAAAKGREYIECLRRNDYINNGCD